MAFHSCTIHGEDGAVVASGVQVSLEERKSGDEAVWHGTITVLHTAELAAGVTYRMVLDDGRAGKFVVRRNTYAGGPNRAVAFQGSGPLG